MSTTPKYVYSFGGGKAEGRSDMKELLGGKGANLAEMSSIGIPVPPGFTITTEVCHDYYEAGRKLPEAVKPQVEAALDRPFNHLVKAGPYAPAAGQVTRAVAAVPGSHFSAYEVRDSRDADALYAVLAMPPASSAA